MANGQTTLAQEEWGGSYTYDFSYKGLTYRYRLWPADLDNVPFWNPERGDPPVTMQKALEVATAGFRRLVDANEEWQLDSVTLTRIYQQRWIYLAQFSCRTTKCPEERRGMFIVIVKMDGSVVEPKIVPKDDHAFQSPPAYRFDWADSLSLGRGSGVRA